MSIVEVNENFLLVGCTDGVFELHINGDNYSYQKIKYASNEAEQNHQRSYSIKHLEGSTLPCKLKHRLISVLSGL